jgi:hypothetical protein
MAKEHSATASTQACDLSNDSFLTSLGAVFLLGKSFLECGVEDALSEAVDSCDQPDHSKKILRHLLAVRCLGQPRAIEAMTDRGVLTFSGLQDLRQEDIDSVARDLAAFDPAKLLGIVFNRGRQRVGEHLLAELLPLPSGDGRVLIIVNVPGNQWIYAEELDSEVSESDALQTGLRYIRDCFGERAQTLVLGPSLDKLHVDSMPEYVNSAVAFHNGAELSSKNAGDSREHGTFGLLKAALPTAQELAYFVLPRIALDRQWPMAFEFTGTLFARAILKHFSRRLFGFEGSSPEYLFQNIFTGLSSIRISPMRVEVHMPESPLRVLLHLSGMYDSSFNLPWLGEREICLLAPPN